MHVDVQYKSGADHSKIGYMQCYPLCKLNIAMEWLECHEIQLPCFSNLPDEQHYPPSEQLGIVNLITLAKMFQFFLNIICCCCLIFPSFNSPFLSFLKAPGSSLKGGLRTLMYQVDNINIYPVNDPVVFPNKYFNIHLLHST